MKSTTQHSEQIIREGWRTAARVVVPMTLLCLTAAPVFSQDPIATTRSVAATPANAPVGGATATTASTQAVKKPGAIRIAIAMPKTQMGQAGNSGAEALRTLEMQYLRGPGIEAVSLEAMLPMQLAAEAKAKECDYILYSTLAEKVNNSGSLFKKAMPMASMIPMVGAFGGVAGSVAGTVAMAAASGAAGLSGNVKAKSEVTYDYKLAATTEGSGATQIGETLKAKAKQDGEDIISPLIEQAATKIVTQLTKH